jgi:hypothetical protein
MRRILVFLLLVTGILMIVIGFAEAQVHPGTLAVHHIISAVVFTVLCIVHIVINRKTVMRYFKGN